MKRTTITMIAAATLLAGAATVATASEVTRQEESSLQYMREEEKLARDVYVALGDRWGLRVFENIARAEQRHMDAVVALLDQYDIDDPVLGPGEFANRELGELYDDLIARGNESIEEALRVGALIEEVDIEDLKRSIVETDEADIEAVYERLLAGSYNHLRAFVAQLDREGVDYEPVVLTGTDFDEIFDGTQRSGRRRGDRRGRGGRI